jgi:hypothetical protein
MVRSVFAHQLSEGIPLQDREVKSCLSIGDESL